MSSRDKVLAPLVRENPVTLHVLGICSALAITNSLTSALIMSVALTVVLVVSNVAISLIRKLLPGSVRIIVQITVIATAVTVIDQLLKAYLPSAASTLAVYISLIVTNCIVLGRAEACAMKNGAWLSAADAVGNGLGFALVLIFVAVIRELFGSGTLMGATVLQTAADGGWFHANALMLLPPSAFFIIGGLVWLVRTWKPEQVEKPELAPLPTPREEVD